MEALLIILIELLFAPLMAAAIAVAEVVIAVVVGIIEFVSDLFAIFSRRQKAERVSHSTSSPSNVANKPSTRVKKIRRGIVVLVFFAFLGTLLAVVVINSYYLESSVRWTLNKAKQRSGIAIDFERVSGNLFSGQLEIHGIRATRSGDKTSDFDFTIETLRFDIAVLSAISRPIHLKSLEITEISGTFERWAARDKLKPRIPFVIDQLTLGKANIMFIDATRDAAPLIIPVDIDSFVSTPFDSSRSVFSVLFRSNVKGKLSGQPFFINTQGSKLERTSRWHASNVAVTKLASIIGGPFKLFESGLVDVSMEDTWSLRKNDTDDAVIHLNWEFTFRDFRAAVPIEYKGMQAKLAQLAVHRFNQRTKETTLRFTTDMDDRQFDGSVSLNGAGVWNSARQAMIGIITHQISESKDGVKSKLGSKILDFKEKLDFLRDN